MRYSTHTIGVLIVLALLAACTAAAPTPVPTKAPPASAGTKPTSNAVRVSGSVKSVGPGTVTLADGTSFATTPQTRVTRLSPITPADLKAGAYVAVTAKLQSDNTLLASIVNVFDESMRNLAPGQRPMTEGNLMTNATIDRIEQVQGDTFTVSWSGGTAQVKLAPDARLNRIVIVQLTEIKVGASISASVADGVAQSVSLQ
ncbi:MAG: hypothetical protein HY675_24745 [Chloroflexi bacterium]|nr:hypothetical protein [Chloroflexota bacterium]